MFSMTGFGKANAELNNKKYIIEIRSLNSKQLDLNLRIPPVFREKEHEIRLFLGKELERGKVDVSINYEVLGDKDHLAINKSLAIQYYKELKSLADEVGANHTDLFSLTLKMPDLFKSERTELEESDWLFVKDLIEKAVLHFKQFRADEGRVLRREFILHIGTISSLLEDVVEADAARIPHLREKLLKHLHELQGKADLNRFEQEMIYYIEKLDISEEKLRLKTHLDYFINTLEEPGSGRKLGFIAQEIGREINTIGSKANDVTIQKLVVRMKDELEKVKEQLLNVL